AALAGAVREDRGDTVGILFDLEQLFAEPVVLCRQRRAKRAIEPRPGAHGSRARLFEDDFAGAVETNDLGDFDAHRRIESDAGAAQPRDELRMSAESDAAAGQIVFVAFKNDSVPAAAA